MGLFGRDPQRMGMDFFAFTDDNLCMRVLSFLTCGLVLLPLGYAQSTSSSSVSEGSASNLNSIRTSQSHSEADGRTTDTQSLERIGMDGRYVPYLDVEKKSVQVDGTTTRTIERTY